MKGYKIFLSLKVILKFLSSPSDKKFDVWYSKWFFVVCLCVCVCGVFFIIFFFLLCFFSHLFMYFFVKISWSRCTNWKYKTTYQQIVIFGDPVSAIKAPILQVSLFRVTLKPSMNECIMRKRGIIPRWETRRLKTYIHTLW